MVGGAPAMNGPGMNQQSIGSPTSMNSPMERKTHGPHPDPDSVKMFVGQIPKSMTEEQLRPMFEEYGPVYHLNVLRKNNEHAGCCFVTYYLGKDAELATKELHDKKQMPGMKHKIQMKPADQEKNAEERKLFVGMLNKKFTEDDVRVMFSPYGTIESCTVLRDTENNSKGCAFVQFTHKFMAQNAIKELHQSTIMEGCSSKLVVKVADTIREKEQKRQTQLQQNLFQQFINTLGPQYMATLLQMMQQGGGGPMAAGNNSGNMPNLNSLQQQLNLQGLNMHQLTALLSLSQQMGGPGAGNGPAATNPLAGPNPLAHNPSAAALSAQNNSLMGLSGGMPVPQARTILPGVSSAPSSMSATSTPMGNRGNPGNPTAAAVAAAAALGLTAGGPGPGSGPSQSLASSGFSGFPQPQVGGIPGSNGHHSNESSYTNGGSGGTPSSIQSSPGGSPFPNGSAAARAFTGLFSGTNLTGTPQPNPAGLQGFPGMTGTNNIPTPTGLGNGHIAPKRTEGCDLNTLSQAYSGIQQYVAAFHNNFGMFGGNQPGQQQQPSHSKQTEGPDGCNLFIYHLPPDFGDYELHTSFAPFGTVLSAKVYIDKKTNLSKCFGFVSYNEPSEAQAAIQAMNGFQIGTKRLKVQLKRSKDKPY